MAASDGQVALDGTALGASGCYSGVAAHQQEKNAGGERPEASRAEGE